MLFFAFEAVLFLAGTVLPTVVHLAFLPLAYAISETAGLNTLILWITYYAALAVVRGRAPAIATYLLSMLSPLVALLPVAHLLLGSLHPLLASSTLPFTTALDSVYARQLIRTVIQYTPQMLAVAEGLATVVVVKLIGRILQTSVDEDDRVRTSSRSSAPRSSRSRSSSVVAGRGGLPPRMRGASLAPSATAAKGGKLGNASNASAVRAAVAEVANDASLSITTSMHRVSKRVKKALAHIPLPPVLRSPPASPSRTVPSSRTSAPTTIRSLLPASLAPFVPSFSIPQPKVAIPLLAGTALALYQFYSLYSLLSDPHLQFAVLVVLGLCVAATLTMAFLLQPGENDAPGAEALLLTMYAALVLTTAIAPSRSVVDTVTFLRSGAATAHQKASFGAKAIGLLQSILSRPPSPSTPSSTPFFSRLTSALVALLARLPWWTAVSLVYRGIVLGAVSAVFLDSQEENVGASEATATLGGTLLAVATGLFTRPLLLLYYGRVIMEAFGYIKGTSTEMAVWLSVGTALVTQLVSVLVLRARDA